MRSKFKFEVDSNAVRIFNFNPQARRLNAVQVVNFEDNKVQWAQRNGTENWEFELLKNGQLVQRGFKSNGGNKFFELILEAQ